MKKNTHLILSALLLFLAVACSAQTEAIALPTHPIMTTIPNECPETLPTAMPMPEFLKSTYPNKSVTKEEYEKTLTSPIFKGVHINISADGIDASVLKSKDVDYRRNTISDRIQLFVDEISIPNDVSTVFDGLMDSGPFYFGWSVNLNIGIHKAKLIFNIDTGETVNYEWAFCILP
jgi:hypothetical protein